MDTRRDEVVTLHEVAARLQEAMEAMMYVRSTTAQRRAANRLWWQVMDRARDALLLKADKVMGDDRRF